MERSDKIYDMTGERRRLWLGVLVVLQLLLLPASAARLQCQGKNYTYSCETFEEVLDLPWEGGSTKVCVVPHSDNARLKVRHSDAWRNKQEVVVRKKSLAPDTLVVLDIDVTTENSKDRLTVRINGTNLQPTDQALTDNARPDQRARTTLLLKGDAEIMPCELKEEREETAREMMKAGGKEKEVTQEPNKEIRTEDQEVTSASLTPFISSATTNTTETEDPEEEPWWSFVEVLGMVGPVPVLVLLVICLLVGILVGCILVCMCSKVCRKRRVEYVPVSTRRSHTTGPVDFVRNSSHLDSLGSKLWSSGIGSTVSTLKTENESPFGTASSRGTTRSAGVTNLGTGVNGSPNTSMNRSRNGSIQSAPRVGVNYYSTEQNRSPNNTSTRSTAQLGVNYNGTGQNRSPNNTGTRGTTQVGVNNLGTGVKRSPTNASISRIHNSAGTLNIPNSSSVTRSSSNVSTDSNTRVMSRSPSQTRTIEEMTRRNPVNITKSSSINRNVNRSPNIPYTKNLGMLASHQERPLLQNPNIHHDSDEDSDDPNYDKPYEGEKPVLLNGYSVPHEASMEPVSVELATMRASSNDPTARQIPVYQFGTFRK